MKQLTSYEEIRRRHMESLRLRQREDEVRPQRTWGRMDTESFLDGWMATLEMLANRPEKQLNRVTITKQMQSTLCFLQMLLDLMTDERVVPKGDVLRLAIAYAKATGAWLGYMAREEQETTGAGSESGGSE